MARSILALLVVLSLFSSAVIAIHTPETRYSVEQTTIEQRNILQSENRFGQEFVQPFGGFGMKGASRGGYGAKGEEEGASNLKSNAFIPQGRTPGRISNSALHARGYQIINTYVELKPTDLKLVERPQITGQPQGFARIVSIRPNQIGLIETTVLLRTKDLPNVQNSWLYEAWLLDEDTGSSMSLGLFQPSTIGRIATLDYKSKTPIDMFESIVVSVEPFPDDDPGQGQIVLVGEIKEKITRLP